MIKKIIILPLGFLLLAILEIACSRCDKTERLVNIRLLSNGGLGLFTNSFAIIPNSGTTTTNSVIINSKFATECYVINNKTSLFNSASAFKKEPCPCGANGFPNPVRKLVFTSNSSYENIIAGASLNAAVKINGFYDPQTFIDSASATYNRFSALYKDKWGFAYAFVFKTAKVKKPSIPFSGNIIANYILNNGDTVKSNTVNFNWQ